MVSQSKGIALMFVGLILPIVFFTAITNNLHERMPVLPFIICPVIMAAVGWVTGKNLKWAAWSAVIGLAEAAILVFTV
jgi:uncharacterized membrane protein YjgN (DUF898 family)